MAGESASFEQACEALEQLTSLTRPQVRGTVRLALKDGGLRPTLVGARQMIAVTEQLFPARLVAQGLSDDDAKRVCAEVCARLKIIEADQPSEGPGQMLARLDRARDD